MAIEQIAIIVVIALVGLSLLSILMFGVRSIMNGKVEPSKMLFIGFPFVLFGVLGLAVVPTWAEAGIYTMVVLIAAAIGAMLYTSFRGVFR